MAIVQQRMFGDKPKRGRKFTTNPSPKGKKQCTKCREVKPISAFRHGKQFHDGLYPSCKQCEAEKSKARRAELKARSWQKHYGLSEDAYWQLHANQGGVCAICKQPETWVHKGVLCHLSVDHDHATGQVRGLLCRRCNHAIGFLRDRIDLLEQAIIYLRG